MDAKIEWMKQELAEDGYYPTEQAIARVLAGETLEFFEPELIDYILELETEWDQEL